MNEMDLVEYSILHLSLFWPDATTSGIPKPEVIIPSGSVARVKLGLEVAYQLSTFLARIRTTLRFGHRSGTRWPSSVRRGLGPGRGRDPRPRLKTQNGVFGSVSSLLGRRVGGGEETEADEECDEKPTE